MSHEAVPNRPDDNEGPALVIMAGPPGTGKSHLVRLVRQRLPVMVVESDAIRHRIAQHPTYTPEESRHVFYLAHRRIDRLLARGKMVVFDATNIYEWGRRTVYRIAERRGARVLVVRTVAPDEVVAQRLEARLAGANPADRSEAGWEVYAKMKKRFQEIDRPHLVVDTSAELSPALDRIVTFLGGAD
ncbi:MAG TPA: ATP-binding protein [Chloroflexota bacterium]|nr:ATP-binding protein [Chloroflexota bacterium]